LRENIGARKEREEGRERGNLLIFYYGSLNHNYVPTGRTIVSGG
jgi:hypothetical protein